MDWSFASKVFDRDTRFRCRRWLVAVRLTFDEQASLLRPPRGAKYCNQHVCISFCLSVCLFVCLSVCMSARISQNPNVQILPNFMCVPPVAVVLIHYLLFKAPNSLYCADVSLRNYSLTTWPWLGPSLTAMQYVMYLRLWEWRRVFTWWS